MNLQKPYDRNEFQSFLKGFLPDCTFDIRRVAANGLQATKEVIYLGHSPLLDLQVFEITHLSSSDARIALATDGFKVMKDSATYRALVAYRIANSDSWRLSLMTATPMVDEKGKVKQSLSNPRRFSFSLGPDTKIHTPEESLIKQGRVKDFEDLKNRFSIEVVNKEFYTQIAVLFTQLAGGKREIGRKSIDAGSGSLKLPSTNDDTLHKEFAVRLIGRLVFCWFLKKKRSEKKVPLLPDEILSSKAVAKHNGFYHDVLEPLFFEVLNTPTTKREKKFSDDPWALIPFLNGGLFTPHLHDFYELGPLGASKCLNTLVVPDKWIKDLFDVFETFNFTIDENTTVDVELSIEPEMLGRIFENLLAEINPETGETARKATGSYYTPRAIVDYMVDESIRQYLLGKTDLGKKKIDNLLSYEVTETLLSESEREEVINALDTIKVIDPACGSGAFPMGILQKMLLILQKVDPESQLWLDRKLVNIPDTSLRKELKTKLKSDNFNYIHKLGIIRDAIYGVDIQPIAMEISKLRFFLSLIVDEEVNDSKENRGVEPLPNLEFKFVCANSLIGLPKNDGQKSFSEATEDIATLRGLRDEYLRSYGPEKKRVQKRFLETQSKMAKHALSWALWGGEKSKTMELSQWDPFSEEPCGWFDPGWMFGINDGFDIVIANPPYITVALGKGQKFFSKLESDILKAVYKDVFEYKGNTFALFLKKAIEISSKEGIVTFIIPNALLLNSTFTKIRHYVVNNSSVKFLVDIKSKVFDNVEVGGSLIIILENNLRRKDPVSWVQIDELESFNGNLSYSSIKHDRFAKDEEAKFYIKTSASSLIDKIQHETVALGAVVKFYQGIITGDNKKFLSDRPLSKKYFKILRGRDIQRYFYLFNNHYVLFDKDLLWSNTNEELFQVKEKLINRQTGSQLIAAYDTSGLFTLDSTHIQIPINDKYNIKYILALFNSKLLNYYYNQIVCEENRAFAQVKTIILKRLPIKDINLEAQKSFIQIVDKILSVSEKKIDPKEEYKIKQYERQIDQLVYNLYGLTKEEIASVEKIAGTDS